MCLERVAERVSSLSKLKSVLVTDSHAQLLQRPCSATYGHEQRRRRLPSSSGDALPAGRVDGLQRQNRAVCAGTKMPAHILPGTRGCSPSGAVLVRTYVSRASSGSVGRQPAARQGFARDGERRPRTARSLGARARQRRNPARLAGRQRLIGHRVGGVGRKKHAHMHMSRRQLST